MSAATHLTRVSLAPLWPVIVGALAVAASDASADVVILRNGDLLSGELKSLNRGLLSFEIDAATSDVQIEWDEVRSLSSTQALEVRLDTGERHFGTLADSAAEASIAIVEPSGTVVLPMARVVFITAIEDTFRERLAGDISAGYSFTEASNVAQFNFGMSLGYEGIAHVFEGSFDTLSSDSGDGNSFDRSNLQMRHSRRLRDRWMAGQLAMFERNESLGIDLRSSIGGGVGRALRETNDRFIGLYGGAVVS
jgi:hypothetical protein